MTLPDIPGCWIFLKIHGYLRQYNVEIHCEVWLNVLENNITEIVF